MSNALQHIGVIGSGNVAWHLAHHLKSSGLTIDWVFSRNKLTGQALADELICSFEDKIPSSSVDLVLICVNDDAIQAVLNEINNSQAVAYTSGTKHLHELTFEGELGVFYPLQTFTKGRNIDHFKVPFFIEAGDSYFAQSLFDLAWKLSHTVEFASSEQRKHLHIAAVMVNNFSNHLFHLAKTHVEEHQLDWKTLQPLMDETVAKLHELTPFEAQTGPARRNDEVTIQEHLALLEDDSKLIYQLISESIQKTYSKK